MANLGPRFNENLNFELPIAQLFDNLAHNEMFYKRFIHIVDKWLTEKSYRKLKDNEYLSELEKELESLRNELIEWIKDDNYSLDTSILLTAFLEKLQQFDKKVANKREELYTQKYWKNAPNKVDNELGRLREIENANDDFLKEIENLKINLANSPILIIQGEAGCGKSHLLGDIATQRNQQSLPTILLLGTTFNKTDTIEKNILNKLDLSSTFGGFLTNLNNIGQQINSRVLILIDAINEGAGADLWKNQIAGFISEVAKYPAIGLVLTIRSTYFNDIIPDNFKSNSKITTVTHTGFKGNEYEALKLFCEYHGLKLPNFPILNPEYSNPLFLHLVCEAVKNLPDKSFPKGFNGINKTYNLYKETLNRRFAEKRPEYKNRRIVSCAIEEFADALFNTEYGQLECKDAVSLFDKEFSQFPYLLSDLIEECVFIKMRYEYSETPKDLILFSYQKLGDFFMAEKLLKPYSTKNELFSAFSNDDKFKRIIDDYLFNGIKEAFAILLPERFGAEIFDFIDFFFKKDDNGKIKKHFEYYTYEWINRMLLNSLKLRDVGSIDNDNITKWLEQNGRHIEYYKWLSTLIELTAISKHPFNSDRLHKILMSHTMPERDGFWQNYIRWYSEYDDQNIAFPLQRLLDWAWLANISDNIDSETARLVAQTLAWVLSSTDIALRDKTTKALINLLEQQPNVLILTLKAFEKVDDLYILERLYAVAYGCILRTEKEESIKKIALYIYDAIFKNGNPPAHILVRDYARNAVEYAIYKNIELYIDVDLIRPPYHSQCDYTPLSNDELDKKYKPKDDNGHWGKDEWGITAILHSMVTEYGRGTCGYGDFGRYTFQSNLAHFNLPNKLNVDLLSNLAVEWIFERYGYNTKLHSEYDSMVAQFNNRIQNKVERIGKKYQWIALYEILAIVADNYKIKDDWGYPAKYATYQGAWQLSVRNIDPAYTTKTKEEKEDDNIIIKTNKDWWDDDEYSHWNYPDAEWVQTIEDLIPPENIIQKQDTEENEWLRLQHYVTWNAPKKIGKDRYEGRRKSIWYIIQGLLVKKSDKQKIINYLKNQNFWGRWLPENRDDHSMLINREKF
ncbi:hypothetical protein AGMMS49938_18020 [Fibrobacterales bacterium]|nr:hypothetical protein AGMMS49938_18020 [Fibrobacterales bacterium]